MGRRQGLHRRFGNKTYRHESWHVTKQQAKIKAKRLRKEGYLARVTKHTYKTTPRRTFYDVYTRHPKTSERSLRAEAKRRDKMLKKIRKK